MYVPHEDWSAPDPDDPPPCFRQGDLVILRWLAPDIKSLEKDGWRVSIDVRTELVAILSACCDLVMRTPPKRKGVLASPLRSIPKHIARSADGMAALRSTTAEAREAGFSRIPPNLFYFAATIGPQGEQVDERVVFLEAMSMVEWDALGNGIKIAELTRSARADLRERIKLHFAR